MSAKIFPVILSGGSGSRLWPLSRESYPKQLLPLMGQRTMLQETALRVADPARFHPVTVVANAEHRFVIAEQLREAGARPPTIVLEPMARNTAPAVATAALIAEGQDPEALILVMPADHVIPDAAAFNAAVDAGLPAAAAGALVLFGIQPDSPATGYGYIQGGEALGGAARTVSAFVEKPDLATAEGYLARGDYYWNSGIFLLPARAVLAEMEAHAPGVLAAARAALAAASRDLDFLRLDAEAFAASPSISIDYAVMERTKRAAVVPSTFVWSDVGAWGALWQLADRDGDQNVEIGDTLAENTKGSYLRSEGPLIAAVGVEDLIVIATPDAVLVASRHADQDVKKVVERLKASNHDTATQTRRVYRPWGWYEGLHAGDRFQVKRLTVNPGGKLSLQKHFHRAEHWVVVNGTAEVHVDGVHKLIGENESVYIPLGAQHRLANPGKVPLNLIEVQSGAYLGEDDIVRFEDVYART
ncbi:mannose-1-phosphate guanylyltransferase/mannose-6-phosphate isomerase [Phenylobacterium sp. J367]|uniref:mannose-1-phosphate guanylyltransferase/mannose-6-phosphate isomerase n=1 Tax=Phenylobacterium sp. J367 TaxID=2898435 RepID=UPI002151E74D|nr:mannose-1-phosphate guanylyltransferase/mannose-6-phosphate isomerase [Phenylobacterium sp. J367]MCR5879496.1 mannose-1-phosphate guanylyltransferase/mannose-6-phosphate isomerase [Phenylobacterium sp. J367]